MPPAPAPSTRPGCRIVEPWTGRHKIELRTHRKGPDVTKTVRSLGSTPDPQAGAHGRLGPQEPRQGTDGQHSASGAEANVADEAVHPEAEFRNRSDKEVHVTPITAITPAGPVPRRNGDQPVRRVRSQDLRTRPSKPRSPESARDSHALVKVNHPPARGNACVQPRA